MCLGGPPASASAPTGPRWSSRQMTDDCCAWPTARSVTRVSPLTHGALTAKLIHDATGTSIGDLLRERISEPLSADLWLGLPAAEEDRVAQVRGSAPPASAVQTSEEAAYRVPRGGDLGGVLGPANFRATPDRWNTPEMHQAVFPGANAMGTAQALAKMWSAAVVPTAGVRLIDDETGAQLRVTRSEGPAFFSTSPPHLSWGAGVMVTGDLGRYLSPESFGHDGAGGQIAYADPDAKVGFAFITNRMGDWERATTVSAALAKALG